MLYEKSNDWILSFLSYWSFYPYKVRKTKKFKQIHEEHSLKVAVLNRSTERAMTDSFRRECFPIAFYQQKASKTEILKPIGVSSY